MAQQYRVEGGHVVMVDFSTATQIADLANVLLARITEVIRKNWQEFIGSLMQHLRLQLETDADPQTGAIKVRLQSAARSAPRTHQLSLHQFTQP
jgi:hypothetical protein